MSMVPITGSGVSGTSLYVVTFRSKEGQKVRHMVATVCDEPGACAVLAIDLTAQDQIACGQGKSWRGDVFEKELRMAIRLWTTHHVRQDATAALVQDGGGA
jgi:hypothetical protein